MKSKNQTNNWMTRDLLAAKRRARVGKAAPRVLAALKGLHEILEPNFDDSEYQARLEEAEAAIADAERAS